MSKTESHHSAGSPQAEIAPLDLDFSSIDGNVAENPVPVEAQRSHHKLLIPITIVLCLIALAVVLVPLLRQSTEPQQTNASEQFVEQAAKNAVDEGTPFQEAELARQRKLAQDSLEQLLEKRVWLEARNVQLWAADAFDKSTVLANDGDEKYRARQFEKANQLYTEGLNIVSALLDGVPNTIDTAMQEGLGAIDTNQAETAREAFELVLAIEPEHKGAAEGLARVAVLEPVNAALGRAQRFELERNYSAALSELANVLALDAAREPSLGPRIAELEQALLDRRFAEQMSLGYKSLDQGQRAKASEHFAKASEMKPDQAAPQKALRMVRNQQSLSRMSVYIERAATMEQAEQWADAVEAYDHALQIDANLSDAVQRRSVATQRMKMDQALQTLNQDPLRLGKPALYEKGLKIHSAAQAIQMPGPRLTKQIELLGQQLLASRESLPVVIQSDGITRVTVQQIAQLGVITEQTVNLIPGRYVALGSRNGYRDVRQEFVVQQGARNVKVDVRCVETI